MSIVAGGKQYKWKGKNIRTVNINGFSCATLPRKDSSIYIAINVSPNSEYEIKCVARNTGGNGKINIITSDEEDIVCEKNIFNVSSSDFLIYTIKIESINKKGLIDLKINKAGEQQGNIIFKEIHYDRVIKAPTLSIPESKKNIHTDTAADRVKILEERGNELKNILATRGNSMAVIGGNGYRWKGKGIRSVHKDGITCIELSDKHSVIMVPVSISSDATYKISISAFKNSGNTSSLLINFFGGKNFDGGLASINISSEETKNYSATIKSPRFPSNLPMYLRIRRPDDSSGKVCVKIIRYDKLDVAKPKNIVSALEKIKKSKHAGGKKDIFGLVNSSNVLFEKNYEGLTSMKFRPYELRKNSSDKITKAMISHAEEVPKVSIITPTRDGLDLLKKCYEALDKNTSYPNWEWVIGDSASTDGTSDYIKQLQDSRIKFIERGTTNGSFSSINNELVGYSSGEYLLFLNNDTEPQPFWLHEMMTKIIRNPEIGIVGAKLMYNQTKIQHSGICFIPQGPANIGHSVLDSFPENFSSHDRFYQAVTGACMLMRAADFKAVGGFDPVYYFCYEDVDLCLKVRKQLKKKVLYAANAILKHSESVTQKKYKTAGLLQQEGIKVFKERWMREVSIDFGAFQKNINKDIYKVDITFVTCVNNMNQYLNYVVNSLFKNTTKKNYEIIPILNFNNEYSAAKALNAGIERARSDIVVLCHQDVVFYQEWVDMLFSRIKEIETYTKKWGILGTAGISAKDDTYGTVHSIKGTLQWQSTKRVTVGEVQTVDEHCMILKKSTGLRFDSVAFNGFHFYGPDICLLSLNRGYKNFGILCPLVHDSASGSLASGKNEFMRLLNTLAKKWRSKFNYIRTPTSIIRKNIVRTFVRFKNNK